ncbi:MAG: outer membrane beta-barrel protein [Bacteroidia bacterium]
MSDHEKLDDFLREKLEGRSFEFKDAYWDAAEKVILADQAARKKRRWFFLIFIFFLTGGGLSSAYYSLTQSGHLHDNEGAQLAENSSATIAQPRKHIDHIEIVEEICDESLQVFAEKKTTSRSLKKTPYRKKITISGEFHPSGNVVLSGEEKAFPHVLAQEETLPGQSYQQIFSSVHAVRPWRNQLLSRMNDSLLYKHTAKGIPIRRRNYFGLTLGNTISPGLRNTQSARAPLSNSPVVGFRYAYAITPAVRFQTGLTYQSRGGLQADSTYRSVAFAFGAETQATTISPQTLHYLEVPLLVDFRLSGRHYVMAGVNVSRLVNSRSLVTKQLILPFDTEDQGTTREWGYTQGFKPVDVSVMAGYGYYLNKGVRVGIQGNYGLRDITDEKFFLNTTKDRNLQLRLILEYDLVHF